MGTECEGDTDFSAQLTKIKSRNPQAVFIPGYYTEVGLIARQARQLGLTALLLGSGSWDSPRLLEIAGETLEGSYYFNHFSAGDPKPAVRKFSGSTRDVLVKSPMCSQH